MAIDDKIRDGKLQYDINREAAKIIAYLSGKIDKYEYLTGKKKKSPNQGSVTQQDKFTDSSLGKTFEKQ